MDTINLLHGLHSYLFLLKAIESMELTDRQASKDSADAFVKTISLSYDTITLKLDTGAAREDGNFSPSLYLECTFRIDQGNVTFEEVYCRNTDRMDEIKKFIIAQAPDDGYPWNPNTKEDTYSGEILNYLTIADEIAKQGYSCCSGDNYRPGYFSKIIVEERRIVLEQINHLNAKSLDHRNDYNMRNLEFFIPFHPTEEKPSSFHGHHIGQMLINFSDGSSRNNKHCGTLIKEKIHQCKV